MPKLISAIHAFRALRPSPASLGYTASIARFARLYWRRRFSPYEIHFYDLLRPELTDAALAHYMSKEEMIALDRRHVLDTYLCTSADKAVFYALCRRAGVRCPELFAVFDLPCGWTPDGRVLRSEAEWCALLEGLPRDFVVKPALGLLGGGVTAWTRQATGFRSHDGRDCTAEELYALLCDSKRQNLFATGYAHHSLRLREACHKAIIQERAFAHPDIERLTGSAALSTCRLFIAHDRDGRAEVMGTAMRLVNGGNLVDNFDQGTKGNLWCSVDLATGRIIEAFAKAVGADRLTRIARHPATDCALVGFRIPYWDETVELAHRLATVFRPQSLLHWDIGVTAAGPIAIEGNVGGQMLPTPLNRPLHLAGD